MVLMLTIEMTALKRVFYFPAHLSYPQLLTLSPFGPRTSQFLRRTSYDFLMHTRDLKALNVDDLLTLRSECSYPFRGSCFSENLMDATEKSLQNTWLVDEVRC